MITYPSRQIQADQLAQLVANELAQAISARGAASLALSGGNTPKLLLSSLSQLPLSWSQLTITTTDERWVAPTDVRSNAGMLQAALGADNVSQSNFLPLYLANYQLDDAIAALQSLLIEQLPSPDVTVLGMGNDGHIASLFPGAENLQAAMAKDNAQAVVSIIAPGAPEPRVSLTLAKILSSKHIHLLINGADKLATLARARELDDPSQMPVCALLSQPTLRIHYAD